MGRARVLITKDKFVVSKVGYTASETLGYDYCIFHSDLGGVGSYLSGSGTANRNGGYFDIALPISMRNGPCVFYSFKYDSYYYHTHTLEIVDESLVVPQYRYEKSIKGPEIRYALDEDKNIVGIRFLNREGGRDFPIYYYITDTPMIKT